LRAVEGVMAFCQLDGIATKPATSLSKGMKQRLSLARCLVHDPNVLILDEPSAGLDPRARIEFRDLLRALSRQGKGILISSHILAELEEPRTCATRPSGRRRQRGAGARRGDGGPRGVRPG